MKLDHRLVAGGAQPMALAPATFAAGSSAPSSSSAAAAGSARLPRIGQHYCQKLELARRDLAERGAPLEQRYQDTLLLLARATDRRVRAQIGRQLKSLRLQRDALRIRQADAVRSALPAVASYFDELQRRNAGERGGSTGRGIAQFFAGRGAAAAAAAATSIVAAKPRRKRGGDGGGGDGGANQYEDDDDDHADRRANNEEDGNNNDDDADDDDDDDVEEVAAAAAAAVNDSDADRLAQLKRTNQAYWNAQPQRPLLYAADYAVNVTRCGVCGRGEMVHQEEEGTLQCNYAPCAFFMPHITDAHRSGAHTDGAGSGGGAGGGAGGGGGGTTTSAASAAAAGAVGGAHFGLTGPAAGAGGDVGFSAYQRQTHFREIVSEFEATKGAVPDDVYSAVRARMVRERVRPEDLTYGVMRGLLMRLQLSKYYNHVNRINAHFGVAPPDVDAGLREALFRCFDELQLPWARLSVGADRGVNVFQYNYVLYQLLRLLGQDRLLPFTSFEAERGGRSNRQKHIEQDARWRQACAELDWVFLPTV